MIQSLKRWHQSTKVSKILSLNVFQIINTNYFVSIFSLMKYYIAPRILNWDIEYIYIEKRENRKKSVHLVFAPSKLRLYVELWGPLNVLVYPKWNETLDTGYWIRWNTQEKEIHKKVKTMDKTSNKNQMVTMHDKVFWIK